MRMSSCAAIMTAALTAASLSLASPAAQRKEISEADYEKIMKEVLPTYQSLRKNLDGKMTAEATKDAKRLQELFKDVEGFWAARKTEDAIGFAKSAAAGAETASKAVAANDFAKALEAHKSLQGTCKSCHDAHRERLPAGGYRIK